MTYKSVFLDIDGTILKPDHTFSTATKKAIQQLQAQDIEVFLATGRPLHELDELAKQLNVHSFIGYNGAYGTYNDKAFLNEPISKEIVDQYVDISKENGHEIVFYTSDKNYFTSLNQPVVQQFIETFELQFNDLYTDEISENILGITVMNLAPGESKLYELEENVHLAQVNLAGHEHCYDVIRKNVNKGKAVQRAFELLNISKEEAIAFGDGMNDKEMFQSVGESFAMGNAHEDLFQYAKHTTTSVSEDGIFNGLQKLGLVK